MYILTIVAKYYLEIILFGTATSVIKLYGKVMANQRGTQALMRTHLVSQYHIYQKQNYIEQYQRKDFQSLYMEFKKFGEDKDIDNLFERILELEIKP